MTYRIGSAQGFYGDDVTRALPMIIGGHVDVVCFEALAELTLAILQNDKLKDPTRGYTFDLRIIAQKILPEAFKRKIPLITNGGGLNPHAAAAMVRDTAEKIGLSGLKIAAVSGDDLLPQLNDLQAAGESFVHIESGEPLNLGERLTVTANAYIGAQPIVEALQNGADIVITGRVADPCLYLAPLIAHYGWAWDDWDKLASGIVAGHLLECTAQVVGGNSLGEINAIDPRDLSNPGYPIAHVEADGSFILTKTPDTPGMVTLNTVKEQLLYEIHDPANYLTPDVVANITTLRLEQVGLDQVRISGVTGKPRPEKLKVSMGRFEGYLRELIFTVGWPEAWKKYEQLKGMIDETVKGLPLTRVEYSLLGANSLYGSVSPLDDDPIELVVRVVFAADDQDTLTSTVRRIMGNGLSGPAGMSVLGTTVSANPRPTIGLWPALISREHIQLEIHYLVVE